MLNNIYTISRYSFAKIKSMLFGLLVRMVSALILTKINQATPRKLLVRFQNKMGGDLYLARRAFKRLQRTTWAGPSILDI